MSTLNPYPAILFMDDGQFGVMFPDLAGCVAMGASIDDALHQAGEALMNHFEILQEQGASAPLPSRKEEAKLPDSFGRMAYSVVMISPTINYYQDIPPHW